MLPVRVLLLGFKVPKTLCFSVVCISSALLPSFLPFSVAFSLSFLWCTSHLLFLIFLVFLPSFILYCCGILISSFFVFLHFFFLISFLWKYSPLFFLVFSTFRFFFLVVELSFFFLIIFSFCTNKRLPSPKKTCTVFFLVGVGSFK